MKITQFRQSLTIDHTQPFSFISFQSIDFCCLSLFPSLTNTKTNSSQSSAIDWFGFFPSVFILKTRSELMCCQGCSPKKPLLFETLLLQIVESEKSTFLLLQFNDREQSASFYRDETTGAAQRCQSHRNGPFGETSRPA